MVMDFSRTRLRADRSIWSYTKVQQAVSSVVRSRRMFAKPPSDGDYLDIGCGPHIRDDFYNLDWYWMPGIQACWDICKGLPIGDSMISGVFSEHCFEHIPFDSFRFVAEEMHRVMKPGAYVRIVVPDAEIYMRRYLQNLNGERVEMPCSGSDESGGIYTPVMSVNRIMRAHGHQFIYDFETMKAVLEAAGFQGVTKCKFGEGADPKLLIDTSWREVESLYVEARR